MASTTSHEVREEHGPGPWAQLLKGRLALTRGKILVQASSFLLKDIFSDNFLYSF